MYIVGRVVCISMSSERNAQTNGVQSGTAYAPKVYVVFDETNPTNSVFRVFDDKDAATEYAVGLWKEHQVKTRMKGCRVSMAASLVTGEVGEI